MQLPSGNILAVPLTPPRALSPQALTDKEDFLQRSSTQNKAAAAATAAARNATRRRPLPPRHSQRTRLGPWSNDVQQK